MRRRLLPFAAVMLAIACGDQPLNDEPLVGPTASSMPSANSQVNFAQTASMANSGPSAAAAAIGGFFANGDLTVAGMVESQAGGFKFPDATVQTSALPSGIIVMWSGSEVPPGWALCDGTNGTPDLHARFIFSSCLNCIGGIGGAQTHTHISLHMEERDDNDIVGRALTRTSNMTTNTSNMPPFYMLAFIYLFPPTAIMPAWYILVATGSRDSTRVQQVRCRAVSPTRSAHGTIPAGCFALMPHSRAAASRHT